MSAEETAALIAGNADVMLAMRILAGFAGKAGLATEVRAGGGLGGLMVGPTEAGATGDVAGLGLRVARLAVAILNPLI